MTHNVKVPICPVCGWWVMVLCRRDDGKTPLYYLKCRACGHETDSAAAVNELPVTWEPVPEV